MPPSGGSLRMEPYGMRIQALDTYDNRQEGEVYEASDHQARQLIEKGLAKAAPERDNKMRSVAQNKGVDTPSQAVGVARPPSSSPAAQVSQLRNADTYPGGGAVTPDQRFQQPEQPRRGRPRKTDG